MVQLVGKGDRYPSQLSGGQQQRVALARALVFEPQLVLMDEPLGALDKQLREHMQIELKELHRQLGVTFVYVTHDQGEALTMSDRVAVFNDGAIQHSPSLMRLNTAAARCSGGRCWVWRRTASATNNAAGASGISARRGEIGRAHV